MHTLSVGDIVSAKIEKIASHGVEIKFKGQKGFIQILELSWDEYGLQARVASLCKVGDKIDVKVTNITNNLFYASARKANPELNPWNTRATAPKHVKNQRTTTITV